MCAARGRGSLHSQVTTTVRWAHGVFTRLTTPQVCIKECKRLYSLDMEPTDMCTYMLNFVFVVQSASPMVHVRHWDAFNETWVLTQFKLDAKDLHISFFSFRVARERLDRRRREGDQHRGVKMTPVSPYMVFARWCYGHAAFAKQAVCRTPFPGMVDTVDRPAFNIYIPMHCTPTRLAAWLEAQPPLEPDYAAPMLKHIWLVFCRGHREDKFLQLVLWLATLVQTPHMRPAWCPWIEGKQGTGKTAFFVVLQELLGRWLAHKVDLHVVSTKFNAQLRGKLLVCIDELYKYNRRVASSINDLITGKTKSFERKYADRQTEQNIAWVLMLSDNCVPRDLDQRCNRRFNDFHPADWAGDDSGDPARDPHYAELLDDTPRTARSFATWLNGVDRANLEGIVHAGVRVSIHGGVSDVFDAHTMRSKNDPFEAWVEDMLHGGPIPTSGNTLYGMYTQYYKPFHEHILVRDIDNRVQFINKLRLAFPNALHYFSAGVGGVGPRGGGAKFAFSTLAAMKADFDVFRHAPTDTVDVGPRGGLTTPVPVHLVPMHPAVAPTGEEEAYVDRWLNAPTMGEPCTGQPGQKRQRAPVWVATQNVRPRLV